MIVDVFLKVLYELIIVPGAVWWQPSRRGGQSVNNFIYKLSVERISCVGFLWPPQ